MNRYWYGLLALVLLIAGCGGDGGSAEGDQAQQEGSPEAAGEGALSGEELVAAAEQEGQALWYTAIPTEASDAVAAAFMEAYPGITVEVARVPSFELWERFRTENSAGANVADVFSPSDYAVTEEAKAAGYLAQYLPEGIEDALEPDYVDDEGYYWSNRITTTGLVYNTDLVPEENAPTEWTDLHDPFWQGKLGIGDPRESSAIYGAYWEMANAEEIGPEFFQGLAENEPILYAQGGQQLNAVTAGEIAATVVVDYRGWQLIADGAPVEVIYPESGVGYTLDYNSVAESAPHPNAARLLMNFLASQEGADVLAENLGTYLTRGDIEAYPEDVDRPSVEDVPLLEADFEQMAAEFEEFNARFDEWIGR